MTYTFAFTLQTRFLVLITHTNFQQKFSKLYQRFHFAGTIKPSKNKFLFHTTVNVDIGVFYDVTPFVPTFRKSLVLPFSE
jgi:hypothetical protein